MVSCRLQGDTLQVREGISRRTALRLDELRLVYLVVRTSARWYLVASSQSMAFVDLDGLDDAHSAELERMLRDVLAQRRPAGGSLALADYSGGSAYIPLEAARRGAPDLLEALARSSEVRRRRRESWLAGSPMVQLRGNLGATATLTPTGFARRGRYIAWSDVGSVNVETTNGLRTDLLLLPHGRRGGMFDFKRFRHSLPFVPTKRKELYQAECTFWIDRLRAASAPTLGQLTGQRAAPQQSAS
jgi:hypothetical protein